MALRIDVSEDGLIEIMRPHSVKKEWNVFQRYSESEMDMAMILIRYWISRDIEAGKKDRWVSQAKKEARKAFKQLEARSPYHGKK